MNGTSGVIQRPGSGNMPGWGAAAGRQRLKSRNRLMLGCHSLSHQEQTWWWQSQLAPHYRIRFGCHTRRHRSGVAAGMDGWHLRKRDQAELLQPPPREQIRKQKGRKQTERPWSVLGLFWNMQPGINPPQSPPNGSPFDTIAPGVIVNVQLAMNVLLYVK